MAQQSPIIFPAYPGHGQNTSQHAWGNAVDTNFSPGEPVPKFCEFCGDKLIIPGYTGSADTGNKKIFGMDVYVWPQPYSECPREECEALRIIKGNDDMLWFLRK